MRKLLLVSLPVLLFISFAFISHQRIAESKSPKKHFDPRDWLIDEATARKMIDNYHHCQGKCRESKKQLPNNDVKQYILDNYTILNSQPFVGRYSDEDVDRYRKARKIEPNEERGNVSGFTTVITQYKVVPKNGSLLPAVMYIYSDDCTICPPPDSPPCD